MIINNGEVRVSPNFQGLDGPGEMTMNNPNTVSDKNIANITNKARFAFRRLHASGSLYLSSSAEINALTINGSGLSGFEQALLAEI